MEVIMYVCLCMCMKFIFLFLRILLKQMEVKSSHKRLLLKGFQSIASALLETQPYICHHLYYGIQ